MQLHAKSVAPNRILLMCPNMYLFYINQGLALREAFEKVGVHCMMVSNEMDETSFKALLSGYAPDVVISINSPKRPAMEEFKNVRHIRWYQDNHFEGVDYSNEAEQPASDICYFVVNRLRNVISTQGNQITSVLRFAAKPVDAPYSEPAGTDFSLIGFIPTALFLNTWFGLGDERRFSGQQYFEFLDYVKRDSLEYPLEVVDEIVEGFLNIHGTTTARVDPKMPELLGNQYMRGYNRYRVARLVLSLGKGCHIYGPDEWKSWPEFAPYHRGLLPSTADNMQVYRETRVNLHNGGTVSHPRVFECMAAHGGPLMLNRTLMEHDLGLEAGVHYLEFDLSDFEPQARELLANPALRKGISEAAYSYIQAHHTWDHRVQQILEDLAS